MARILITPADVRKAGADFKRESQASQAMIQKLSATMQGMQPQWDGLTSQKFYQDYSQWKSQMTNFVELLTSIGTQLDAIATRFEQADQAR